MTAKVKHWVAQVDDLAGKKCLIVQVNGIEIGIYQVSNGYYAWRNMCPHAAAPVCEGVVCGTRLPSNVYEYIYGKDQEIVRCPWHGWEFDLTTGRHLADESVKLRGYELSVEGEQIFLMM